MGSSKARAMQALYEQADKNTLRSQTNTIKQYEMGL